MNMDGCRDIEALIVRAADDSLGAADRVRLDAHVTHCASCRDELDAQRAVRGVLRSRTDASVPLGFEHRVMRRLRDDDPLWLPLADWRRWSLALSPLPILLMVALVSGTTIGGSSSEAATSVSWEASDETSGPDAPVASIVWQPGMSEESIFVAALTADPRETLQAFYEKHADER